MKRSEIDAYIDQAAEFFSSLGFHLPEWALWGPETWKSKSDVCAEIWYNQLGWGVTDFGSGRFTEEGLTLFTLRNGNVARDRKIYCEKIMMVREGQVIPVHFHWKKMEDIISRGGGVLCMKLWKADTAEQPTDLTYSVRIDGIETEIVPGTVLKLRPGQSICFEPYMYHTFWAEDGDAMVGEVSTVNDDVNDNRFLRPLGRFATIEEDAPAKYLLCNEYPAL